MDVERFQLEYANSIAAAAAAAQRFVDEATPGLSKLSEQIQAQTARWRRDWEAARQAFNSGIDYEAINRDIQRASESLKGWIEPALAFQRFIETLPARTKIVVLKLGRHGWFIDPEMTYRAIVDLGAAIDEGHAQEAEQALAGYYRRRAADIAEELIVEFPLRANIIRQAFDAHARGEYALSIPVLIAQVDGICREKCGSHLFRQKNNAPRTRAYVDGIADEYLKALLSPLAEALPINANEQQRPRGAIGALNRHEVLHGDSVDYPTEENSLRAISLLTYVAYALRMR